MGLKGNSNLRFIRGRREEGNRVEIFVIYAIIKIDTDQIAGIEQFNLVHKAEVDQGMNKIIGEDILEVM